MLFFLLSLISSKTSKATARDFPKFLAKSPISLTLFTSVNCQPCKRIQTFLDKLSTKYHDGINFLYVDMQESQPIFNKYNIQFIPQIALFRNSSLLKFYEGQWSYESIEKYVGNLLNESIEFLNDSFSVFNFINKEPSSLLLTKKLSSQADSLYSQYGGAFHVGVVENDELSTQLNLPPALFSIPHNELSLPIDDLDDYDLLNLSHSPFTHLKNSEFLGTVPTQYTYLALVDEHDPSHVHDSIIRMKLAHSFFGSNISYIYCDFFVCENVVRQLGLVSFLNPCNVVMKRDKSGRQIVEPFRKLVNKPDDVLNWLKFQILNIQMPKEKEEVIIPRLYADDFIPKALDPKIDAILLVAATGMNMYDESISNFKILIQVFKDIPTVKFYEFNRFTEHVQGLEIPQSDKPLLSIWPASKEPRGSSFGGYLSLQLTFENLLKLIQTPIPQEKIEEMTKQLNKFAQERQKEKEKEE